MRTTQYDVNGRPASITATTTQTFFYDANHNLIGTQNIAQGAGAAATTTDHENATQTFHYSYNAHGQRLFTQPTPAPTQAEQDNHYNAMELVD